MARIGGRQKGTGNMPASEKIRQSVHKLLRQNADKLSEAWIKGLLDKALAGDVEAAERCYEILKELDAEAYAPEHESKRQRQRRSAPAGKESCAQPGL